MHVNKLYQTLFYKSQVLILCGKTLDKGSIHFILAHECCVILKFILKLKFFDQ